MNKSLLLQIIQDQKQLGWKDEYIERERIADIQSWRQNRQIIIITGIRRCGKSTLLQQIRKKEKYANYYMNFDDERLLNFRVDDFQTLYELFIELYGEQDIFFFDEIQNIAGWERFIRRLHDYGKKIYLTGSNATMLSRELGTRLTGRYSQVELFPFSFKEYLKWGKVKYDTCYISSTAGRGRLRKHFHDYLMDGGIPDFVKTRNQEYLKWLYEGVLYRDILARHNLSHEKPLKELVFYIASNIGKEMSFNSVRKMLGLGSATTIKEYFNYLEDSYLTFLLPQYSPSVKKQMYLNKKMYFIDNALAKQIGFRFSEDKGRLMENLIWLELKRRGHAIFFHQGAKECDFILREKNQITQAIQVTTNIDNESTKQRELDGLLEAMETYKLKSGLILTDDYELPLTLGKNRKKYQVNILPAWKWLLQ